MKPRSLTDGTAPTAIVDSFIDAWNRHDAKAMARLFSSDADFVNVVGIWWKNRDEIEAAHAYSHTTFFRESRLRAESVAVKSLTPEVVTMHTTWELSGQIEPDGSVGHPRRGILLMVLTRNSSQWVVHTAQNTDINPGALTVAADKT